jgi:hypothetical protein
MHKPAVLGSAFLAANLALACYDRFNLLLPLLLCGALYLALKAWATWRRWPRPLWLATGAAVFGLFALLALLEAGLRWTGTTATYLEKVGQGWKSPYADPEPERKWFHLWTPHITFPAARNEFSYVKKTNSEGLPDSLEYAVPKPDSVFRIIALGDSFTEGVGAPQDSAWPQRLRGMLGGRLPKTVEVVNAGVSGSDPVYALILLQERLARYRPDHVLLMVNHSDVDDLIARGGRERFRPDSTARFRGAPWFEPVYRSSYVFRLFAHGALRMDYLYLTPEKRRLEEQRAVAELAATVRAFQALCGSMGCRFTLVLQPMENELRRGSVWLAEPLEKALAGSGADRLDLLDCFRGQGDMMGENVQRFYWPIDRHFNSLGYDRVARCIAGHCSR